MIVLDKNKEINEELEGFEGWLESGIQAWRHGSEEG